MTAVAAKVPGCVLRPTLQRMNSESGLIKDDISRYLEHHERKEILKFLTCGSVDDGKSTLIGRLLHDTNSVYEDQLTALKRDSKRSGRTGDELDLSLLVDGLVAEREQGITIDVAYRYFSTAKRKFIIADCPGHEQYTRNMVTGASNCELAVILIDTSNGLLRQTLRHTFIANLLGIRHIVVAVNKMDLVNYSEAVFNDIQSSFELFVSKLHVHDLRFVPISAKNGDNVVKRSNVMKWYNGSTILDTLESVPIANDRDYEKFRMVVQRVNRPSSDFRGYSGTLASGIVKRGDTVRVLPSGQETTIDRIVTMDGELPEAFTPMAVTLVLSDEIDVSRGDIVVDPGHSPQTAHEFDATLVWMHQNDLRLGKQYLIKHGATQIPARVESIHYHTGIHSLESIVTDALRINEIGSCKFVLARPIVFDNYSVNRSLGAFVVIDRLSNLTVGAGMIGSFPSNDQS